MIAYLENDPQRGSGYGILKVNAVADSSISTIIIRRAADNFTLAPGAWRQGQHDIIPLRIEYADNAALIWLGPEIIDNLADTDRYELIIPGLGTCAIIVSDLQRSHIVAGDGSIASSNCADNIAYEGVEPTPVDTGAINDGDMPSGVAAAPGAIADRKPRGCLALSVIVFVIWAAGAWLLWHWAMEAPVMPENEKEQPFELMPRAEGS